MLKPYTRVLPIAAALAFVASAAMAQGTTPNTVPHTATTTSTNPATIGVTPQEAKEAMDKASPNAETGTLVRTEPSIEKRVRMPAKEVKDVKKVKDTKNNVQPLRDVKTTPRPDGIPANKTTGTVTNTTTPNAAMGITGTMPGADDTSGDATNTHDNAQKNKGSASGTSTPVDAMGNQRDSTPSKQ